MRFTLPIYVLAAVSATVAENCAVCPDTLLPGVSEIGWSLVFHSEVDENVMFCGYHGQSFRRPYPKPISTFCEYTNSGTLIPKDGSWHLCRKTVDVEN
ncbi:hypothetical protein B0H17DRAFT_1328793 [Mycena rosella]|uniref:Uncharacterized protein n=1 Tax=Mycena rosella TaxID=1033263 RepID=A0AAD7DTS2_MYCRO|nr:hypothetical protein B0H17DRAFT_1328793 [Mycena rosella]